jgi:hypothetical protein
VRTCAWQQLPREVELPTEGPLSWLTDQNGGVNASLRGNTPMKKFPCEVCGDICDPAADGPEWADTVLKCILYGNLIAAAVLIAVGLFMEAR